MGGQPAASEGRTVEANFIVTSTGVATDYDRACDVEAVASMLEIGSSWGLVLNNDVSAAAWMKSPDSDIFFIVRVLYANDISDEQILRSYNSRVEAEWAHLSPKVTVEYGDLILMHAATIINEIQEMSAQGAHLAVIGGAIVYRATPGEYAIDICEVELPEEAQFTFLRFIRI